MNRRKTSRPRRASLKLYVERLESRRLMSAGDRRPQLDHAASFGAGLLTPTPRALESRLASRTDADSFAWTLAHRPRLAADLGLGALSTTLRQHAGYADRHGWGASLEHELATHPRYAAAHHLTALIAAPTAPTPASGSNPIATSSVTTTSAAADSSPTPTPTPPVVVQDPLATAVGGYLDVALPNLGLGSTGVTYYPGKKDAQIPARSASE